MPEPEPRIVTHEEILSWEAGPLPPRRKARILVDEQIPRSIAEFLRLQKAKVYHVAELPDLRGRSDEEVAHYALKHNLILLSVNAKDFGHRRKFPIEHMPFTVILPTASDDTSIFNALRKVLWFILSYPRYDKGHKMMRMTVRGDGVLYEDRQEGQRTLELYPWDVFPIG